MTHPQKRLKSMPMGRTMPLDVGLIHFVGIGGIGMSGIAELLHNLGYQVQGSDVAGSANVKRLRALGITVHVGHEASNVEAAEVVVISTAIKPDNAEVQAAREARIPVVRRAEMLAELMRMKLCVAIAGTHGKTTTTALTAAMFEAAGRNPTVINGGILGSHGTNAYLGSGEWMIVEADESDGTFNRIPATIGTITNIDPEHLDHYGSFDNVKAAFAEFVHRLPFYGAAILCIDHPEVQKLAATISDRRIITYGTSPQADIRASNIRSETTGARFDITITGRDEQIRELPGVLLAMHGNHNVLNALAAVAVAVELGMEDATIEAALKEFKGVSRRFTYVGEVGGVTIIDDYAHHPVEITATLQAARQVQDAREGRVIAVVQPHRYTRLRDLFDEFCGCFNDADAIIVTDVHTAGEAPIEGFDSPALVEGLKRAGLKQVHYAPGQADLAPAIQAVAQSNDMVVCMGAGSISSWAHGLLD